MVNECALCRLEVLVCALPGNLLPRPDYFIANVDLSILADTRLLAVLKLRDKSLAEALENQIEWGVWGGMTERERRALLRRRPGASWRAILEAAREQQTVNA